MLADTPVRGSSVFADPVTAIGEAQLKAWLIDWVALRGYLDLDELATFDRGDSRLQGHEGTSRRGGH